MNLKSCCTGVAHMLHIFSYVIIKDATCLGENGEVCFCVSILLIA